MTQVCMRLDQGQVAYFGAVLTNTDVEPITLVNVDATTENAVAPEFSLDLGEGIGAGKYPVGDDAKGEAIMTALLARMRPYESTPIPPGAQATVVIKIAPEDAHHAATLHDLKVFYKARGTEYEEQFGIELSTANGKCP